MVVRRSAVSGGEAQCAARVRYGAVRAPACVCMTRGCTAFYLVFFPCCFMERGESDQCRTNVRMRSTQQSGRLHGGVVGCHRTSSRKYPRLLHNRMRTSLVKCTTVYDSYS